MMKLAAGDRSYGNREWSAEFRLAASPKRLAITRSQSVMVRVHPETPQDPEHTIL
jgi:hypothetical protein